MYLNGGSSVEDIQEDSAGKYAPFDFENESPVHIRSSNVCADGAGYTGSPRALPLNSNSSVSVVDVLKTLFFILVWYTFSTFLTLYNKSLLGDDLGKFPAPLLMNTVHFTMQAVLSKLITWYWSHRFLNSDPMTRRDYFYKVVPTALSTALDVNLSNASLVFISVTFATMVSFLIDFMSIVVWMVMNSLLLESPSLKLLGIILVISVGILLTGFTDVSGLLHGIHRTIVTAQNTQKLVFQVQ
ncbi:hypothetical protein V6N13_043722 [Hibiscus sabdariffa]